MPIKKRSLKENTEYLDAMRIDKVTKPDGHWTDGSKAIEILCTSDVIHSMLELEGYKPEKKPIDLT